MPLTRAQAEDFVQAFFRDHRLDPPRIRTRKKFMVTMRRRKHLNLPREITRLALADQVAARLCREVTCRDKLYRWETANAHGRDRQRKRPKFFKTTWHDFAEWRTYLRGVVVHQFGKGDGLE